MPSSPHGLEGEGGITRESSEGDSSKPQHKAVPALQMGFRHLQGSGESSTCCFSFPRGAQKCAVSRYKLERGSKPAGHQPSPSQCAATPLPQPHTTSSSHAAVLALPPHWGLERPKLSWVWGLVQSHHHGNMVLMPAEHQPAQLAQAHKANLFHPSDGGEIWDGGIISCHSACPTELRIVLSNRHAATIGVATAAGCIVSEQDTFLY